MGGEFVDTNILVYAHDLSAEKKRRIAKDVLLRLVNENRGLTSVQVQMEFFVAVPRKIPKRLPADQAAKIIGDLATWKTFSPESRDVLAGIGRSEKYKIGFWDAMIVQAAAALDASVIWSEDLNHGQVYKGVMVKNPFK